MRIMLETPRLTLREWSFADLDFVATLLGDPEVTRFYPKQYTRDEAAQWIQKGLDRYARDGHGFWLVEEKATGQPLGIVGLLTQIVREVPEAEVGYLIHRPFWRQGFATEAALATRDYGLNVLKKPRVISMIRPENVPSQGVARKMGMRPEAELTLFYNLPHHVFWTALE